MTFFPLVYYLCCYIFLAFVDASSIVGNGVITLIYVKYFDQLRKLESLYLIAPLSITSLIDALLTIPQLIYFIGNWHSDYLDYDAETVLLFHIVTLVQLKVDLTINTAVALDRMQVYLINRNVFCLLINSCHVHINGYFNENLGNRLATILSTQTTSTIQHYCTRDRLRFRCIRCFSRISTHSSETESRLRGAKLFCQRELSTVLGN